MRYRPRNRGNYDELKILVFLIRLTRKARQTEKSRAERGQKRAGVVAYVQTHADAGVLNERTESRV
jgi:hypothetical protein